MREWNTSLTKSLMHKCNENRLWNLCKQLTFKLYPCFVCNKYTNTLPRLNWMFQKKAPYAVRRSSFRFPCVYKNSVCVCVYIYIYIYNNQHVALIPTLHLTLPSSHRSSVGAQLLKHFISYSPYLLPQVTVLFPLLSVQCLVSSMAVPNEWMSEVSLNIQ